jgi:hypothetical protein
MLSVVAAFNGSLSIYRNGVRCAVLLCGAFVLVELDYCLDGLKIRGLGLVHRLWFGDFRSQGPGSNFFGLNQRQ